MARWLGLVVVFGVLSNLGGDRIDNAAHVGGAVAGAAIARVWKRGFVYSDRARKAILAVCAAILVACIAIVAIRVRVDPYATMTLEERLVLADVALEEGRCGDAVAALGAATRLTTGLAAGRPQIGTEAWPPADMGGASARIQGVAKLRDAVEKTCGQLPK
jgi:hypothetical protein